MNFSLVLMEKRQTDKPLKRKKAESPGNYEFLFENQIFIPIRFEF